MKEKILLSIAPVLFPVTFMIFQLFNILVKGLIGYLFAFIVYWLICIITSTLIIKGEYEFIKLYKVSRKDTKIIFLISIFITFIPVILTFCVSFLKVYHLLTPVILVSLISVSIINGLIEEFFWRGAFFVTFKRRVRLAYVYPTIFFAVWHISLYFYSGIKYQGGFFPLVGGAAIMGAVWAWSVWKQKTILFTTMAHIFANFFAFSMLLVENWK